VHRTVVPARCRAVGSLVFAFMPAVLFAAACGGPLGGSRPLVAADGEGPQRTDVGTREPAQLVLARQSAVRFRLVPLQTCPSNGFTLPIVSPDGTYAAVQSLGAARWQTLLASSNEHGLDGGRITMHDLTKGTSAVVPGGEVLLGRSADTRGCLIESPRPDGSRWIGLAPWDGSEPQWLVQDEQVNAFASIGPKDRLVWCRRAREGNQFDLVVRHADGEQVIPAPEDGNWLAPQFTGDGRSLVVLRLRDGVLSACCFAVGDRAADHPERVLDLSWRATAPMAYQTVVPQRMELLGGAQWAFFHPRFRRVGLWDVRSGQSKLFGTGSASIVQLDAERFLVATTDGLDIDSLTMGDARSDASRLLDGVWVPLLRLADDRAVIARMRGTQVDIARLDLLPPN